MVDLKLGFDTLAKALAGAGSDGKGAEPFDLASLGSAVAQLIQPGQRPSPPPLDSWGGSGSGVPTSGPLVSLPQNGGASQTVDQLMRQQEAAGGSRSEALFGDVRPEGPGGALLPEANNYKDFFAGDAVPEGRDDWFRGNDQLSIQGLDDLVASGKIGPNTVVISDHGHGAEVVQRFTSNPALKAEAEFMNAFETEEGINNGQADAKGSLNQAQTYLDSTLENQGRNGKGGTVVLATDAHGYEPARETMPSAEELKKVMGPDVNIVYVNEAKTGTTLAPAEGEGEVSEWLADMQEAGIKVEGFGIDSRNH